MFITNLRHHKCGFGRTGTGTAGGFVTVTTHYQSQTQPVLQFSRQEERQAYCKYMTIIIHPLLCMFLLFGQPALKYVRVNGNRNAAVYTSQCLLGIQRGSWRSVVDLDSASLLLRAVRHWKRPSTLAFRGCQPQPKKMAPWSRCRIICRHRSANGNFGAGM